jgi:hypothetical protein
METIMKPAATENLTVLEDEALESAKGGFVLTPVSVFPRIPLPPIERPPVPTFPPFPGIARPRPPLPDPPPFRTPIDRLPILRF